MIVKVTQKHIDKARRAMKQPNAFTGKCCPVAQALNKKYRVGVIKIHRGNRSWDLPKDAVQWIDAFDHMEPVNPFQFTINLD